MVPGEAKLIRAFTLVELLVVIALIALLASLLLPVLSQAKAHSLAIACGNNSKQLGVAWRLYADDNGGKLVNNDVFNGWTVLAPPQTGQQIESPNWVYGIMDWSASPDNTNAQLIADGLLFPYTPQANVYKCPADHVLSAMQADSAFAQRARSVALNAFIQGAANPGAASVPGFASYAKETDLGAPAPSLLWVFADEHPDTINDGWFRTRMDDTNQWDDVPGSYHNGACVFDFADGHVEVHKWVSHKTCQPVHFARDTIQDPGSVDIHWMYTHTSVPVPVSGVQLPRINPGICPQVQGSP